MSVASYPYVFDKSDLEGIRACNEQHGFAIVKGMLPQDIVDRLKAEVEQVLAPAFTAGSKLTMSSGNFVESSPTLVRLMTVEPFMAIVRHLHDHEPMTLNRSAAIYSSCAGRRGAAPRPAEGRGRLLCRSGGRAACGGCRRAVALIYG